MFISVCGLPSTSETCWNLGNLKDWPLTTSLGKRMDTVEVTGTEKGGKRRWTKEGEEKRSERAVGASLGMRGLSREVGESSKSLGWGNSCGALPSDLESAVFQLGEKPS